MGFFGSPVRSQDSEVAASSAVRTTTKWVARAVIFTSTFLTCLYFALYLLHKKQLLDKQPVQISIGAISTFVMASFALKYAWDQINNDVRAAILAAAGEKIKEYREQNPSVIEIERMQLQDYSCLPNVYKSEDILRLNSPNQAIHDRRVGRDTIIKGLAYNDRLLKGVSLGVVKETLRRFNRSKNTTEQLREIFLTDIYSYLKVWLMLSIMYNHTMPIYAIKQRYPDEKNPDRRAYREAIEIIRAKFTKNQEVLQVLKPRHPNEPDYSNQAVELLQKYLDILVDELNHPSY